MPSPSSKVVKGAEYQSISEHEQVSDKGLLEQKEFQVSKTLLTVCYPSFACCLLSEFYYDYEQEVLFLYNAELT